MVPGTQPRLSGEVGRTSSSNHATVPPPSGNNTYPRTPPHFPAVSPENRSQEEAGQASFCSRVSGLTASLPTPLSYILYLHRRKETSANKRQVHMRVVYRRRSDDRYFVYRRANQIGRIRKCHLGLRADDHPRKISPQARCPTYNSEPSDAD